VGIIGGIKMESYGEIESESLVETAALRKVTGELMEEGRGAAILYGRGIGAWLPNTKSVGGVNAINARNLTFHLVPRRVRDELRRV